MKEQLMNKNVCVPFFVMLFGSLSIIAMNNEKGADVPVVLEVNLKASSSSEQTEKENTNLVGVDQTYFGSCKEKCSAAAVGLLSVMSFKSFWKKVLPEWSAELVFKNGFDKDGYFTCLNSVKRLDVLKFTTGAAVIIALVKVYNKLKEKNQEQEEDMFFQNNNY